MTSTPNPTAERGNTSYERLIRHLIAQLRQDSGDYAKAAQSIPTSHELVWDARDVRAWDAATALETLLGSAHGLLPEGAPNEEQIAEEWERYAKMQGISREFATVTNGSVRRAFFAGAALTAAGVAPQEPSKPKQVHEPDEHRVYCVRCGGGWPCQPTPSPDREKLIAEAFPFDGSDPSTVIECRKRVRNLLAAPVAVDEAKLAEVAARVYDEGAMDAPVDYPLQHEEAIQYGRDVASAVVKLLGGGER